MISFRSFAFLPLLLPRGRRFSFFCSCSASPVPDMARYKEVFTRRMAMAGIKPHHRIALGVSGGPDSMALCVLAAEWKSDSMSGKNEASGFIDGILGIVVDHRLRAESADEAIMVQDRVNKMGIRCEIASCEWLEGRPKLGHLQEAARDMRYNMLKDACIRHQIGVLLIAHHADDQAELFILRLSRNSGVLGLAGMPFVSQLFTPSLSCIAEELSFISILLVRPLLDLLKHDMYKICQGGNQEWVEDPTNRSPLYTRNRIRASLRKSASNVFSSELKMLISACQLTRSHVEHESLKMIENSVTITEYGYAVIDLEKLNPSFVDDICLSRYATLILQTSLTAAGCYVSPAPQSRGMKILICYSTDSPQSSKTGILHKCSFEEQHSIVLSETNQITRDAKVYFNKALCEASSIPFVGPRSSNDLLTEAREINLINESTQNKISLLKLEEHEKFSNKEHICDHKLGDAKGSADSLNTIRPGDSCHYMSRFLITWKAHEEAKGEESCQDNVCQICPFGMAEIVTIRHMVDADWLYLADLSKGQRIEKCQDHVDFTVHDFDRNEKQREKYSYLQLQASTALKALKSIPVPARRGLPVIINSQGLLLSMPSISFSCSPSLSVTAVFKPLVPLGGGYSSYF